MTKVICKMYNHNKWWSIWWNIRVVDALFYKLHDKLCPEHK